MYENLRITLGTAIQDQESILKYEGSSLFTTNAISVISGPAKSMKSFLRDLLTSKVYNPDGKFESNFDGKTLILDTEQGSHWVQRSLKRLKKMGAPMEHIDSYAIKTLSPSERLEAVEALIREHQPKLVIIDGVVDLLDNLNDHDQTSVVINKLMYLVAEYQIHISTVLHLNPGQDQKVRGALGTALQNKADAVVRTEVKGTQTQVKPMFMRDANFAPFKFVIDEYGVPKMV